jgi:fumarylpyruvate hydrolase
MIPGGPFASEEKRMSFVFPPPAVPAVPVAGGGSFPVRRIYCVGRNYVEHAQEMGHTGREDPFFFLKPADTVVPVGPDHVGRMHYPSLTQDLHHEVELVVAIGEGGFRIDTAQALDHVFGYAVGLDMTRRDLQAEAKKLGRPWDIGKGFDESAPISHIRPAEFCKLTAASRIQVEVNQSLRQDSTIGKLIWSVPEIIAHVSRAWRLEPGDLIYTGTPAGVAAVRTGDILHAVVEGVGHFRIEIAPPRLLP